MALLRGAETQVHAEAACTGAENGRRSCAGAEDRLTDCRQARPDHGAAEGAPKEALKAVEHAKAAVRAFVEYPFHIVKNLFRHRKTWYRGLAKNGHQLHTLFALAKVMIAARPRRKKSPPRAPLGLARRS